MSSRLNALRDPDEPDQRHDHGDDVVGEQLHAEPAGDHDPGRSELRSELRQGAEVRDVVEQSGRKDERATGDDPEHLGRRLDHAGRDATPMPATRPQ